MHPSDLPDLYAIAPTMFDAHGRLDAVATAENVLRIADRGVHAALLTGAYGEFQVLSDQERTSLTRAVTDAAPGSMIMSGAAAQNGSSAIDIGARLFDAGAHQVMVSAPFAAEFTDDDLQAHFAGIARELDHDLVIYNNPVFGVDLSPRLLENITVDGSYIAVKQGTQYLGSMTDSVTRVQETGQARIFAAADLACAAAIGAGASGVTSTNIWAFPEAFMALADPTVTPSRKASLLAALRPYADIVRALGQPRTIKAAMVVRGYAGCGFVRAPYTALEDVEIRKLTETLAQVDDRLAAVAA